MTNGSSLKGNLILAEAEAQIAEAIGGLVVEAIGAAQKPGAVEPTAAPNHASGTARGAGGIFYCFIFIFSY